jgi:outer membrane murein-binding lipoprotein Lpp
MKKFVLAGALVVASLFLAGCSAPSGDTGNGNGATGAATSKPGAGACVNGEADFTTSNAKVTLPAVCKKVIISGHDISLTATDVTDLTISGNTNTVNAAVLGGVTVVGDSNTVKTTTAGAITVNGNTNTVTALGPIGDVSVTGANDTVTTPGKIGAVTQSGIGNKIGAP